MLLQNYRTKKLEQSSKKFSEGLRKQGIGRRSKMTVQFFSSFIYSTFWAQVLWVLRWASTYSENTTLMEYMRTNPKLSTYSREPFPITRLFALWKGWPWRNYWWWKCQLCLVHFLKVDWKCIEDSMASSWMLN